jgi:TonB family protein
MYLHKRASKLAFSFMEFYIVKESIVRVLCRHTKFVFALITLSALTALNVSAQNAAEAEAMQRRLMRARALAAAHNLNAAAAELDNIRNTTTDESIKDVARIMLMGVYLEAADYARAQALLEETYKGFSGANESSLRAYFTLAGQSVKGAREHLDRYKAFGINVVDKDLPPEAAADLDRLRSLLERVAEQARQISDADAKSTEAVALLEDVSSARVTLARSREERLQWQSETTSARQKLAISETRVASLGPVPMRPASSITPTTSGVSAPTTPATTGNNSSSNTSNENGTRAQNAPLTRKTVSIPETKPQQKTSNKDKPKQEQTKPQEQPVTTRPLNAPKDGQPVEVGPLIDKATQRVAPNYPATAKMARITGIVKVFIIVNESGAVTKIERSEGPALLRVAAESAAKQWKFQPVVIDGKTLPMTGFITFNFTL